MLSYILWTILFKCAFAPLPNRVERASIATVDTVLHRIRIGLQSVKRMLVWQECENFNSARRTTNELFQNLRRIQPLLDQAHFNRVETDLCTVSNQIDAAIMRINNGNVVPVESVNQKLPRTS